MEIKNLIDEDVVNYKKTSLFVGTAFCDFKCCKECGQNICQNSQLIKAPSINYNNQLIVTRYLNNPLTNAIVIGGLEPFTQWYQMLDLIKKFREKTEDDIVIYTGYYKDQITYLIQQLKQFKNIIVKFGRYIPGQKPHYDSVLGVQLANDEQHAQIIN